MGRKPIKCDKCGVYLSSKGRDELSEGKHLCNRCSGINYSSKREVGRKMLWKSK